MTERISLDYIHNACVGFSALMIAYMGGRLHKIEKNRPIMIAVGIILAIGITTEVFVFEPFVSLRTIGILAKLFAYVALCFAYTARFEKHKSAGLEDK